MLYAHDARASARPASLMAPPVVVLSIQSRIGNAMYERLLVSHYFFGAVVLLGVLIAERLSIAHRARS